MKIKKSFKKIGVVALATAITIPMFASASFAAHGTGLLNGITSDTGVTVITDGDHTTSHGVDNTATEKFTFTNAVNITDYLLDFDSSMTSTMWMYFYDDTGSLITSYEVLDGEDNVKTPLSVNGAKSVMIQSGGELIAVNELEMYGSSSDTTAPAEVTSLNATTGDGSVTLDYVLPTDSDFSNTNVYYSSDGGSTYTQWTEAGNTDSTATVTGLTNGTSYQFKVTTVDATGNESTGNTINATPSNDTTSTSTTEISSGNLSIGATSITSFPSIVLDGTDQVVTSTLNSFQVSDATGTGNGYHVTVEASQFTEVGGAGLTLPLNSLTLAAPTSVTAVDTKSPAPTVQAGAPWVIDSGSATTILSAAVDQGLGAYDVNFGADNLSLTVPSGAKVVDEINYPDTPTPYESVVTFSIISGP